MEKVFTLEERFCIIFYATRKNKTCLAKTYFLRKEANGISKLEEWEKPSSLVLLRGWAREGMSLGQIAKRCGVGERTLCQWKNQSCKVADALQQTKELADKLIEEALYERAKGYTVTVQKEIKCKQVEYDPDTGKKLREWEEIVPVTEEVYIGGNLSAMQFWLKNRKPEVWNRGGGAEGEKKEEIEIIDDI